MDGVLYSLSREEALSMRRPRRNHSPAFKARAALELLMGEKTIGELSKQLDVRPHQVTAWKNELLQRAAETFGGAAGGQERLKIHELHANNPRLARCPKGTCG